MTYAMDLNLILPDTQAIMLDSHCGQGAWQLIHTWTKTSWLGYRQLAG